MGQIASINGIKLVDLPSDYFAWYTMDANGTDETGNHNAAVIGSPVVEAGKFDNAIRCSTINNYLLTDTATDFSVYSHNLAISFWLFKVTSAGGIMGAAGCFNLNDGVSTMEFSSQSATKVGIKFKVIAKADVPAGWSHFVCNFNACYNSSGTLDIWQNGAKLSAASSQGYSTTTTTAQLKLGKSNNIGYGSNALVDQLRFYSRLLTDEEIALLYAEGA